MILPLHLYLFTSIKKYQEYSKKELLIDWMAFEQSGEGEGEYSRENITW